MPRVSFLQENKMSHQVPGKEILPYINGRKIDILYSSISINFMSHVYYTISCTKPQSITVCLVLAV